VQRIETDGAAAAIGPYSQAIRCDNLLFVSGQIPLDPATGELVSEDIGEQTHRALQSLSAILEAAGSSLDRVVKTTVFLTDLDDFQVVNSIYATYFAAPAPARSTVQVSRLPKAVSVEIDAIAVLAVSSGGRA
jgi:2-iminobutanoate/2-iminopropanoate deaminase